MTLKPSAVLLLATIIMLSSANASVINYVENIDGEFSNDTSMPTYVGELGVGLNTITGATYWTATTDVDVLSFRINTGQKLTSLIVNYASDFNFEVNSFLGEILTDNSFSNIQQFLIGSFDSRSIGTIIPSGTDILSLAGINDLPSGDYEIKLAGFHKISGDVQLDYNFDINVAVVPLPASVWLFITGLMGLIKVSRNVTHNKSLVRDAPR